MMELVRFIFTDFWHFAGAVILIVAIMSGIAEIIEAIRRRP